jgi:DNA-binding response OmpR family regulator
MGGVGSKPRLLVVDDNLQSLKLLRFLLTDQGYDVIVASEADTAHRLLEDTTNPIHLVLLDVMMPNVDGFDFCNQVRRDGETVPIIFLSARSEPADRAEGLKIGADDYIVKPFDPGELLARIGAVLRRSRSAVAALESQPSLRVGDVELDPARLQVKVAQDRQADLTPTETKLLHCLMRNAGRVLSRDALINQAWDYDHEGFDNTVDVHIGRLRKKLEADPTEPRYIRTVRGVGYVFNKVER